MCTHTKLYVHVRLVTTCILRYPSLMKTLKQLACVRRNWWRQGVVESSPDPVLGGNQRDGMGCFEVNLNHTGTWR